MRKIFAIIVSCVSFTSALYGSGCIGEPDVNRGNCGFYARIDALGWKANQLGTQYAHQQAVLAGAEAPNGRFYAPDTGFRGAFRVGGGYITECTGWTLESYWTHFFNKSNVTKDQHQQTFIAAFEPVRDEHNSTANFHLNFNTVDIALRKSFYAAPCFSWEPHVGIQGVWIRETENAEASLINTTNVTAVSIASNFNGVGMTGGLGMNWDWFTCLGGQWSMIGDTTISLVTGKTFYSHHDDSIAVLDPTRAESRYNYQEVRPIYDLKLGLRWESCLCKCWPLTFDLVWESMYLPNTFKSSPHEAFHYSNGSDQIPTSGGLFQPGDLSFSGVTLTCRFGF